MVFRNQDLNSPCILLLKCQCLKLLSEDRARGKHTHNISWACWGKNTLLYFSLTHTLTMLLTPVVGVFHTASNSLTPAGCPITHSSFGTTYTVLASDPTSERLSHTSWGFPQNSVGKESTCNARRPWFNSWVGKIPWKRERLPTPVFWPGEFHGLYSPWSCKESHTTERLSLYFTQVIQSLSRVQLFSTL